MSLKRKATSGVNGHDSKRQASEGLATPATTDSDESYHSSEGDVSEFEDKQREAEKPSKPRKRPAASQKQNGKQPGQHEGRKVKHDFSDFKLKDDHESRPIWTHAGRDREGYIAHATVIVESFSHLFRAAQDFLVAIAEPQSRPQYLHEYKITDQSLLSASSVGLESSDIIRNLEKFSKSLLPDDLKTWIYDVTEQFGKVKLVLKHNEYFVESQDAAILQKLLHDPVVGPCRIEGTEQMTKEKASNMGGLVLPGTKNASGNKALEQQETKPLGHEEDEEGIDDDDMFAALRAEDDEDDEEVAQIHSFRIAKENVEKVKERCMEELKLPITEEYDFRNDTRNANLDIDLRPSARIRDYQEKSLSKMFGNGRSKSGIIVLPCGAGKTLVGITAACTVKKGIVILCTSSMSVVQWKSELLKWSNINPNDIAIFTSDHKDKFTGSTGIIISTYSMVTQTKNRSYDAQKMMDFLTSREWGLMILDEVHVVPAFIFRKVSTHIAAHSKLGLTATLLREDNKIRDLGYLIGPKLYEANWMELADQGHIARVQCAEVWCPMTTEFYAEYLRESARRRMLLYTMNPKKFQACQYLIDYHEKRGDKIIVFSDNVYTLKRYSLKLRKAYIYGGTPQNERLRILDNFQHNPDVNTIFLSKIGDTSLDLPEATCLIQISSHYGSRRQEAQRLGRILRAKRRNDEGFNAFFYSLVSKDTNEMFFSSKRQAFLVDQGYAFKVITHLTGLDEMPGLAFKEAQERRELLQDVMLQNEMSAEVEEVGDDMFSSRSSKRYGTSGGGGGGGGGGQGQGQKKVAAKRMAGQLSELSGGQDMAYMEYNKGRNQDLKEKGKKGRGGTNDFMRKLQRDEKKRRDAAR
ncbi:MAG: hypothetical protein M1828_002083 [Chrysothrix sp. TS-e1954]|nr:MAG: hypothetical protein M1828_002083 [Chrysothrix sp. TS-e1954]